jgi:hypothetical protein
MDPGIAFCQSRRAIIFNHVLYACFDFRFAFQVNAPETDARIGRGRQKRHRHPVAAMQADTGKTAGAIECLLLQHSGIKQAICRVGK